MLNKGDSRILLPNDSLKKLCAGFLPGLEATAEKISPFLKQNKKILISAAVILPAGYIADVWLLGSASAVFYDLVVNLKSEMHSVFEKAPVMKVNNASWYFGHPFTISWAWLTKSSSELSTPGVRDIWAAVNMLFGSAALAMYCRGKWYKLMQNKNDSRHVHGLKVVDNPAFGTTRWAGPADISHLCEFGPPRKGKGGVVLGKLDGKIVRIIPGKNTKKDELGLTGHVVVYGVTGSGKSYTFGRNNIIAGVEDGQSMIIMDSKGELLYTLGPWLKSLGYDVPVFNLVNPEHSHRWNPIMECLNDEEIAEMASCMIENAAKDNNGYFVNKEVQLFEAISGLLKDAFKHEQAHPRSALSISSWTKEKLEQVFSNAYREKKISATIYERWRGAASANLDNATSGLTAKLKIITTRALAALMSGHEIDLESIGKKKTALFCILPVKGSEVLKPILSVFYMFLFNRLYELADKNGGRLPVEVRFVLDEFANIGRIPGFSEKISTARSLGILLQYILQGRSQLNDVYGYEGASNILASTPISLLLGVAPDDEVTKELFSNKLGEAAVEMKHYRKDVSTVIQKIELPKETVIIGRRKLMEKYEIKEMSTKYCIADVQASKPMFMRKVGWVELPQAADILRCGRLPVSEYIPARSLEIELPIDEMFDNAGGVQTAAMLWGIKKASAGQGIVILAKEDEPPGSKDKVSMKPYAEAKADKNETDKKENMVELTSINPSEYSASENTQADDVESRGFNVSSPII
ncbi:MAG: type IV secretory system conjugative DNA transfer family protein [Firmicutes bacterium]|nr:type IV secretory system conjugative DNA transfer family protein [Bacillota bacterium]